MNGNTKYLADLARTLAQGGTGVQMLPTADGDIPILPVALEGPYGASTRLPDLLDYDKVLLVAGGVGATFIMPIYRSMLDSHGPALLGTKIRCIWAVQKLAETQWAFPDASSSSSTRERLADAEANGNGVPLDPSSVEVYVTRPSGTSLQADASASGVFAIDPENEEGEAIELQENEHY